MRGNDAGGGKILDFRRRKRYTRGMKTNDKQPMPHPQIVDLLIEASQRAQNMTDDERLSCLVVEKQMAALVKHTRRLISEGIIKSYPAEFVSRKISEYLTDNGVQNISVISHAQHDNELPALQIAFPFSGDKKDEERFLLPIEKEIERYGWFYGQNRKRSPFPFAIEGEKNPKTVPEDYSRTATPGTFDSLVIFLKARYPISNSTVDTFTKKVLERHDKFYHVSFERLFAKIYSNADASGLVPQEGIVSPFLFPERVYLFGNLAEANHWIRSHLSSMANVARTAYRSSRKIGNDVQKMKAKKLQPSEVRLAPEEYQKPERFPFSVFEVDLKRAVADGNRVRLFRDNNFDPMADSFFTDDQIPKQYLRDITSWFDGTSTADGKTGINWGP